MTTICFVCREGTISCRIVQYDYEKYLEQNNITGVQTTISGTRQGNPYEAQIETINEAGILVILRDPKIAYQLREQGVIRENHVIIDYSDDWVRDLSLNKQSWFYEEISGK